jgi:hypothetical protein
MSLCTLHVCTMRVLVVVWQLTGAPHPFWSPDGPVFPADNPRLPAGYPRLQSLLLDMLCRDPDRRMRSNEIVGRGCSVVAQWSSQLGYPRLFSFFLKKSFPKTRFSPCRHCMHCNYDFSCLLVGHLALHQSCISLHALHASTSK